MGENMSLTHAPEYYGKVKNNSLSILCVIGAKQVQQDIDLKINLSIFSPYFIVT